MLPAETLPIAVKLAKLLIEALNLDLSAQVAAAMQQDELMQEVVECLQ